MLSPRIAVQAPSTVSASAYLRSVNKSSHLAPVYPSLRTVGYIAPKVSILNAPVEFTPEAGSFYAFKGSNLLAQTIIYPGFSSKFPEAHRTANGEIYQATMGEGAKSKINAAATTALLYSRVNLAMGTIGPATFARFEAQVALQYEFDVRSKGANFSTGYIPIGATEPEEYHPNITPYQFFHPHRRWRVPAPSGAFGACGRA